MKDTKLSFEQLNDSMDPVLVQKWKVEEEKAMLQRGEALSIYDIRTQKAPSQAEMQLALNQKQRKGERETGTVDWLTVGLALEHEQYVPCKAKVVVTYSLSV